MAVMTEANVNEKSKVSPQKTRSSLTVAEFLLEQLAEWGIKRIFGVIGDANLYVLDAIAKQNKVQYIACRHECSAALMASAEAKLTGRVGVCMATSGPGIANLLNGLADAAADHAGVLAITGQIETTKIGTNAKQYINQQQLIAPIATKTELVAHPDAFPQLLRDCLLAAKGLGEVAHLSIPKDLLLHKVKEGTVPYPVYLHQALQTPESVIKEAAVSLFSAERPIILAGRGTKGQQELIIQLAESLQAPVVTTYPARPLFPNNHPLYVGGLGQGGSEASSTLLGESDLILILGATWWPDEYIQTDARIIQIDQSPLHIGTGHMVEQGIVGDLKQVVPQLLNMLDSRERQSWVERVKKIKSDWSSQIELESALDNRTPLAPQQVMKVLADWTAADAIIAVDTGDHTLWFNRIFQASNQEILISGKWRTLGFALPAAIAAGLEFPDRQVIALAGDGGSVQTLMEFITAVQYQLPLIMIVMNNGSYAMEKNRMVVSNLNTLGSELVNPNFAQLAEACGGIGKKATTVQELQYSLQDAQKQRKPMIIEVLVDAAMVPHTKI